MSISRKDKRLLDEVRDVLQLHHYSIQSEHTATGLKDTCSITL